MIYIIAFTISMMNNQIKIAHFHKVVIKTKSKYTFNTENFESKSLFIPL